MTTSEVIEEGFCAKCGDTNLYTSLACSSCGARLPWADAVSDATKASKQKIVHEPVHKSLSTNPQKAAKGRKRDNKGIKSPDNKNRPITPSILSVVQILFYQLDVTYFSLIAAAIIFLVVGLRQTTEHTPEVILIYGGLAAASLVWATAIFVVRKQPKATIERLSKRSKGAYQIILYIGGPIGVLVIGLLTLVPIVQFVAGVLPGFSRTVATTTAPTVKSVRVNVLGKRDVSTPSSRLMGHWADAQQHYYYQPVNEATQIGVFVTVSKTSGKATEVNRYKIVSEERSGEIIWLDLEYSNGEFEHTRYYVSKNAKTLKVEREDKSVTYEDGSPSFSLTHQTYIDGKTRP